MSETTDRRVNARLREVFEGALDLSSGERVAFLDGACGADGELRAHVERLLAADARATSFLERPAALLVSSPALPAGRRLGPYELVREIGRGGMGTVYLGRRADRQFERDVAIKVVPARLTGADSGRRFRQEQQILARLTHPNIAQLFDAGADDDGLAYVVMELVEGEPIDEYCRRTAPSIESRLDLVAAVCDVVQFAHRNLVVHRDLKPSNIFVTASGTIKLLDFGIAKLLDRDESAPDATRTAAQPMTPAYAAPEQVTGRAITTSTDVYALGLLLYELLTGRRAHQLTTSSPDEIVRIVCDTLPAKPSDAVSESSGNGSSEGPARVGLVDESQRLRRRLAGELDTIVLKAISKEPERRYVGPADLADDLRRFLAGRPVLARPDSSAYRVRKFVRRHALGVAAAGIGAVALAAAVGVSLWQAREAVRARADADAQRAQAIRRFNDVRTVATDFVFEFHDAIATLSGATPARALVVRKGVEYLDGLGADTSGDRSLQQDLAAAYERMAQIQASPYESNVGDLAGSLASAQKALALRDALAEGTPPDAPERQTAIAGHLRLGDALQSGGRVQDAVAAYRRVVAAGESALEAGGDLTAYGSSVGTASNRLCGLLLATGDGAGALAACDVGLKRFEALEAADPSNRAAADGLAALRVARANALRVNGRPAEALDEISASVADFRERIARTPSDARLQQQLATILIQQGVTELMLGRDADALASNKDAIALFDALRAAEPGNARVNAILSFVLLRQAPVLVRAGRVAEAAASTSRGLAMLRAQVERPGAGPSEKNDYASWLLTCEPESARQPAVALRYAREAVAAERHPMYMDTLALARFRTGDVTGALEMARSALALVPAPTPGARPTGLRAEIERHLEEFSGAAGASR